jgi:hypothetical protein
LPEAGGTASGRKVTTTPAAMVVPANTIDGRSRAGVRSPVRIPTGRSAPACLPGRPATTASPASEAAAPTTNTGGNPA